MNIFLSGSAGGISGIFERSRADDQQGIRGRLNSASTGLVDRLKADDAAKVELSAAALRAAETSSRQGSSAETTSARSLLESAGAAAGAVEGLLGELKSLTKRRESEVDPRKRQSLEREIYGLVKSLEDAGSGSALFGKTTALHAGDQTLQVALPDISRSGLEIGMPEYLGRLQSGNGKQAGSGTTQGTNDQIAGNSGGDAAVISGGDTKLSGSQQTNLIQADAGQEVPIEETPSDVQEEPDVDKQPGTNDVGGGGSGGYVSAGKFQSQLETAHGIVRGAQNSIAQAEQQLDGVERRQQAAAGRSAGPADSPDAAAENYSSVRREALDEVLTQASGSSATYLSVEALLAEREAGEAENDRSRSIFKRSTDEQESEHSRSLLDVVA